MISEEELIEILNANIIPLKVGDVVHYDINFKRIAKSIIDKIKENK